MPPAVLLDKRRLNRALLARQLLLRRERMAPLQAVERLVGLQAQNARSPYYALWSRLRDFRPDSLEALLLDRRAVRAVLMRSTVHLLSSRDYLALRGLFDGMLRQQLRGAFGKQLHGVDVRAVARESLRLLRERPRVLSEIGKELAARHAPGQALALSNVIRNHAALVQLPPRGLWSDSGMPVCDTAAHWLGRAPDRAPSLDDAVRRYLGAFGPASVADAAAWSRLPGLRAAFERLRPELKTFRDEAGRELFDLLRAPRPRSDVPAPPRFLPDYDNALLAHADRSRIVAEADRRAIGATNERFYGSFLVDGFVAGVWRIDGARLTLRPQRKLPEPDAEALAEEGLRLIAFTAGAAAGEVRILAPRG